MKTERRTAPGAPTTRGCRTPGGDMIPGGDMTPGAAPRRGWIRAAVFLVAGLLGAPAWVGAAEGELTSPVDRSLGDQNLDPEVGRTWIVRSQDNICGLKVSSQLSNPAKVDYSALLDATPQMQEMKRRGIDASSPEGIALKNAAVDAIAAASDAVRSDAGHCSVWKSIRHKNGDAVPDITQDVIALLGDGE